MSPPGKNSGLHHEASVVKARRAPLGRSSTAASPSARQLPRCRTPARTGRGSAGASARRRRRGRAGRARRAAAARGSESTKSGESLTRAHPVAAGRPGSRRRTPPRSRPSARRAASPACTRVPNAGQSCGLFSPRSTSPLMQTLRLAASATVARPPEDALGVEMRRTPRAAAGRSAGSRRCRATPGRTTSKTSSTMRRAGCVALAPTARAYWFSTSARPASSWRTACRMPSSRSTGSNPVTTIGTR